MSFAAREHRAGTQTNGGGKAPRRTNFRGAQETCLLAEGQTEAKHPATPRTQPAARNTGARRPRPPNAPGTDPTSPRPAHPNRGAWSLMPRPVREGCCPEERHEAPARQHRSDTNIVITPPPLSPVVLAATRGMLSLPSTHYLPSVPPTPAHCYKSDGARRGATRPHARHCDCDCGRLRPTPCFLLCCY